MNRQEFFLQECQTLANKIPCQLCRIKGGSNIETDGSCRHSPLHSPDFEMLDRLKWAVAEALNKMEKLDDV